MNSQNLNGTAFYREEIWCRNGEKKIYGQAWIPFKPAERKPLVIFCHELGKSHRSGIPYAERLAGIGYAVYCFDFCGGSVGEENLSDGENIGMSMITEMTDLSAVVSAAESWDFADPERIYLLGASQGGVVSALFACRHPSLIRGLMMMYPPLYAAEGMRKMFGSREKIPEVFDLFNGWIHVGKNYAADLWEEDFYGMLAAYKKKTLLLHGDMDRVVNIAHSERAKSVMPDCEFHVIAGARHGFHDECFTEALGWIMDYLARV